METIRKALEELTPALWPQEARVSSPVPDKIVFTFVRNQGQLDLLFHFRADGIYFQDVRQDLASLTPEGVQQLVIERLTAYVNDLLDTATT
jgi:hypothetical protein